jgi:hypothetical protein
MPRRLLVDLARIWHAGLTRAAARTSGHLGDPRTVGKRRRRRTRQVRRESPDSTWSVGCPRNLRSIGPTIQLRHLVGRGHREDHCGQIRGRSRSALNLVRRARPALEPPNLSVVEFDSCRTSVAGGCHQITVALARPRAHHARNTAVRATAASRPVPCQGTIMAA